MTFIRNPTATHTDGGKGRSTIKATVTVAEIRYRGHHANGNQVDIYGTLQDARTNRKAYTEFAATRLPVSYGKTETKVQSLSIGGLYKIATGKQQEEKGWLTLEGGVERDISSSGGKLAGTSSIPGMASFSINPQRVKNKTRPYGALFYETAPYANTVSFQASISHHTLRYSNGGLKTYTLGFKIGL